MNVLLTGGAGYLGTEICSRLPTDYKITALDNLYFNQDCLVPNLLTYDSVNFVRADVRSQECRRLVQKADVVIHLAALVGAPLCDQVGQLETFSVNEFATRSIVHWLSRTQKIIFFVTNSGYGKSEGLASEVDELNPLSTYAKSKVRAEKYVLEHPGGTCLRLATCYGLSARMRFDLLVNDFINRLFTEKALSLFEGNHKRNAVSVSDVSRAVEFFLKTNKTGLYNLAQPECNLTKKQFAEKICYRLGLDPDVAIEERLGTDLDGRDCHVSSEKILSLGFCFESSFEKEVDDVITLCENTSHEARNTWRNA